MKAALIVVDVQRAFYELESARPFFNFSLPYIKAAIEQFHEQKMPVVFIKDIESASGPSDENYDILDCLPREASDFVISKVFSNAFWKTELEQILNSIDVEMVIICGFAAGGCVNFTYNGAIERGFKVAILQNGVAGTKDLYVRTTQELCETIGLEVLTSFLMAP